MVPTGGVAQAGSSADYQVLFDLLPVPAWVFEPATRRFLSVNHAAIRRYGYTRDQFLSMTLDAIRPAEDVALFRKGLADAEARASHTERGTWRHKASSGEVFNVEVLTDSIRFRGRDLRVTIAIDVSDRQRVQEALDHSRRRLQALFDNALDAILVANDEGVYVDANAAACALLGCPRAEVLRMRVWELRGEPSDEKGRESWNRFLKEGRRAGEYTIRAADGARHDVEFRAVANVLPGLHLSILRDVTARNAEREGTEKQLRALNDQLRRVSARARARREEDRTRLARELHDQLGQALAGLKIDLCWLADHHFRVDSADAVASKIHTMTALVDDTILRVRRLSSELRPPVLDRLGLVAAFEWQIEEFQRRTGIHVRFSSRVDHVPLDRGRSTAVFRIFQEALTNVATHAEATRVRVKLSTRHDRLVLAIADNGRGIAPEEAEGGESLGLIGMRERAQLLDGDISVRPARGRGTLVTLWIPLKDRRRTMREPWV